MRAVVGATSGVEVVAEAQTGEDALAVAARSRPDLFLVDVHLPGIDGCELTRRLKVIDPDAVVFLMSSDDDPALQDASASSGAPPSWRRRGSIATPLRRRGRASADRPAPP